MFKNAEYIVTDSFHGCVFSVIFNKQFVVRISQLGERIDNLLTILNIRDRVVKSISDVNSLSRIDYDSVNPLLENFRLKSEKQLDNILSYFSKLDSNGIVDSSQCTGCLVCQTVCRKTAIDTRSDAIGFIYPEIRSEQCVGCRACEIICESLNASKKLIQKDIRKYYSALNRDPDIVKNSGSGGIFHALAEMFIKKGGSVYGAAYQDGFAIAHERADSVHAIFRLMGTKYTQSSMSGIYEVIASDLKGDGMVLFVGTPCQCAAVRTYVKQNGIGDGKLYVVDLFCHGVFSPGIWREYIAFLESKFSKKITSVSFRDKSKGWRNKHFIPACMAGDDIEQPSDFRSKRIDAGSRQT